MDSDIEECDGPVLVLFRSMGENVLHWIQREESCIDEELITVEKSEEAGISGELTEGLLCIAKE